MRANPPDPITAVTHSDPYGYYAHLATEQPFYHDDRLGLWVASSAEAVAAVLTSDLCRVRPPAEPVPKVLLGSAAADLFRHLVRMNDGRDHEPFKRVVAATLRSVDEVRIFALGRKWAQHLAGEIKPESDADRLSDFAFLLPVYVVADLLGIRHDMLHQTAQWTSDFVRCLAPASSAQETERGKVVAGHLLDLFRSRLAGQQTEPHDALLAALARQARCAGHDDMDVIVANGVGFLSQAYEATAGLIGNALVALVSHPDAREQVTADPGRLRSFLQEVLRYDSPIQNTRRFIAGPGTVAGQEMMEGDIVLVVLAAANRDPAVNPEPERFDILREGRRVFTFGVGSHTCPGEALATAIAEAGIEQLLQFGIDPTQLAATVRYRPSANARIPLFGKRWTT